MIPGVNAKALEGIDFDDKRFTHIEAIIQSMTADERENKVKISPKRKERIAKGSGTSLNEVNSLLKQFEQMQKMMKQFSGGKANKKLARFGKMKFPM